MPYFEVELERQQTQKVLIEADDKHEAEEGAWELADEHAWNEDDGAIAWARELGMSPTERYWSGGPKGAWVDPK